MARQSSFRCRVCGATRADSPVQYCDECFGPLDLVLGPLADDGETLRARIQSGPASMWRYADLLPFAAPPGAEAVGWTPLVEARALGADLGVTELWLKDEAANPGGSFKDRVVAAALGRAIATGAGVLACASTGNLAFAVAGAARRAGLTSVVLVPDALAAAEQAAIAAEGAVVVPVAGDYDAANRLASEASMAGESEAWGWVNIGLRPWYVEGSVTVAHEIAEQLGWRVPDAVVAPMASGAFALALHRGFVDLADAGLVPPGPAPALWVVQPEGCAPVATAFALGAQDVAPVRPETVATSLAMGDPPDGPEVLAVARASTGGVLAVPEGEIAPAQARLAQ
ncbi:MAG TPA: pyridoxal-phosphate dependent enzyme, partial [Acidimicrobiales bacterium]|nr:pyridoxal-phosphate dependent enzyme [Acidimicrobiales bacterium]